MTGVGQRIKSLRIERGLTQSDLAERLNVSYQQIQKYENGTSSVTVDRLFEIAAALGVRPSSLIESHQLENVAEPSSDTVYRLTPDEVRLVKLFRKIRGKKVRDGLIEQIKGIIDLESST